MPETSDSVEAHLAALEELRQQYHRRRQGFEPRLQRLVRFFKWRPATAAERLLTWWESQLVPVFSGASRDAIDAFEARNQVCLPDELRTFYLAYGGLASSWLEYGRQCSAWLDDNDWRIVFNFSTLDDLKLMDDCGDADFAYTPSLSEPGLYFQIADFLIESHVYAVRLTAHAADRAPIFALVEGGGYQCTDSFDRFARMYIEAPDLITHPPNREEWLAHHAADWIRNSE